MDLEKKAQEIEETLAELKEAVKNTELKDKLEALEEKFNKMPEKVELKDADEIKSLNDALNDINKEVKGLKTNKEDSQSFTDEIKRILNDPETKASFEKGEMRGLQGKSFEMKVDTTAFIGDVSRSQIKPGATYDREQLLTVTPLFTIVPMEQDKSRMLWVEGSYTSNVGYVGEGSANDTEDTGAETEYTREIAKISAKMSFTEEMFEDRSAFATRLQNKLLFKTEKFINSELVSGDGNDTDAKKHIYGLKTQGTTEYSTPTSLVDAFSDANIDDLAVAINVQADVYTPSVCLMNKATVAKYSRAKDSTGQLIIREVNGQKMLGGMSIIESYAMDDDELIALDPSTLELWLKRGIGVQNWSRG